MMRLWRPILAVGLAVPAILLLWLYVDGLRPFLRGQGPIYVDIQRGTPTREIALTLEQAGVIRSHITFLGLHLLDRGNTLKAGEYEFNEPISAWGVLRKIIRGEVSYEILTVIEGNNRFEIANAVAAAGFGTREEFLAATEDPGPIADLEPEAQNLEGFLFPDSYRFPRHVRPADIVRSMVARFREVQAELGPLPEGRSMLELVTIASLVEKETGLPSEREVIAGVFYNRLERGMALQADPTVVYAAILEDRFSGTIRRSDLEFDSPYNTYVRRGLPPGPIANPGRASLAAAMNPAETDYLFFVASVQGGHVFSRTLSDHNAAVAQYRRDLRELQAGLRESAADE